MEKLKEHKFPYEYCIGGWYLPDSLTNKLVKHFNQNKDKHQQGGMYTLGEFNVNKDIKESTDMHISRFDATPPIFEYRQALSQIIQLYEEKYPILKNFGAYNVCEDFNFQRYKAGGGFKIWHCERHSTHHDKRLLVFCTYLNTVKDGGTEFQYLRTTVPAVKGLTVLFPVEFTHTHRSQIAKKQKTIITGWLGFDEV